MILLKDVNCNIRLASYVNLNEIISVFKTSIECSCVKDYTTKQINAWTSVISNEGKWKRKIKEQYFIIAELKNKIVGFTSLEKNHLDLLYVHPDFQCMGIGRQLYSYLEAYLIKNSILIINTDSSITASSFFLKMGFSFVAENTVHINGESLLNFKMEKYLIQ